MTVAELIDALTNEAPDAQVVINVGGTQVDDFDVETGSGVITLQGRDESAVAAAESSAET